MMQNIGRRLLTAGLAVVAVLIFSVAGYLILGGPDVSFLQALYMAVITLAGIGYSEIVETAHNPTLRVFNMFVVLVGVTIMLYAFSAVTAFLVEGQIQHLFWRRKMQKKIGELRQHYIVCGAGDTGRYAAQELQKTGTPYVVIEMSPESVQRLVEHESKLFQNVLYIQGDATDEAILDQAGIDRAAGLIAGLNSDKDNLVITVMARQKNPQLRIVARCADVKFAERITRAGANSTVSPTHIGGMRLASEAIRPHVVSFLDMMLREQTRALRIEEIAVKDHSGWIGSTLEKVGLRTSYNLLPLAVKKEEVGSKFVFNPSEGMVITAGTVVIVMGDVADVQRARAEADTRASASV
jgi:voltage-gated potassium channel